MPASRRTWKCAGCLCCCIVVMGYPCAALLEARGKWARFLVHGPAANSSGDAGVHLARDRRGYRPS